MIVNCCCCLCDQASKGVEGLVRFILLNPVIHFQEIVKKSRSVILAGGTMQPVSELIGFLVLLFLLLNRVLMCC